MRWVGACVAFNDCGHTCMASAVGLTFMVNHIHRSQMSSFGGCQPDHLVQGFATFAKISTSSAVSRQSTRTFLSVYPGQIIK